MNDMPNPTGLSASEADEKRVTFGDNRLPEPKQPGLLSIFLRQYKSPFIYVLLVAATVSLLLGQEINAIFIFLVLFINAGIATFQEYAAQKAATGLQKMVPHRATVFREGKQVSIDATSLVPGDVMVLGSGDKVAADARMIFAHNLQVDESMLTGESIGVEKSVTEVSADNIFAGTTVLRGRGFAEVIAIGANTELGKIATEVSAGDQASPPLMQRIDQFTRRISISMLILISMIFVITLLRGDDLTTVFFLGVALAVSAIPEGLPVAITVALAIGMQRMAKRGVIIRNLVAVESLGSCTFIGSDKTGTLTVNEMTIRQVLLADGSRYTVSGEGIDTRGTITPAMADSPTSPLVPTGQMNGGSSLDLLTLLVRGGIAANEAYLEFTDGEHSDRAQTNGEHTNKTCTGFGDSVDQAFLILAEKHGTSSDRASINEKANIPYESENAYSASIIEFDGQLELFVKGSFESLSAMCGTPPATDLGTEVDHLASNGFRVLAVAHRILEQIPARAEDALHDLTLLGIVGMIDPLRPEVIGAIQECRAASINIAMITGDHPATAQALGRELGLVRAGISRPADPVISGQDLEQAAERGQSTFDDTIRSARIFARVAPQQKMQIVDSMIRDGQFVAVTGDGVNDAPALKHAHIGIAMGRRGCDVARDSADMILTDDNFASIVAGIREGRIVYNNIRKVIFLLISTGAAEIALILLSLAFGTPLPLLPLQLLWLNLVTNGIQDVALVFEPEEGNELTKPPRRPDEPIFDRLMIERVIVNAIIMGCLAFAVFYYQIQSGVEESSARNVTLLLMVLFENVHVFNSRSETLSVFRQNFFTNPLLLIGMLCAQAIHIVAMHSPYISDVLQLEPVSLNMWTQLLAIAMLLVVVDELHKLWLHRGLRQSAALA